MYRLADHQLAQKAAGGWTACRRLVLYLFGQRAKLFHYKAKRANTRLLALSTIQTLSSEPTGVGGGELERKRGFVL